MKKILGEFKTFVMRGNVIDLAVGVIIGAAFQAIVNSLVNDVISPFLGIFGGMNFDQMTFDINGSIIYYGKFLTAVLNFLIMAVVVFILIKSINTMSKAFTRKKKEEEPAAPTTKVCPFCKSEVNIEATRCPHCTSELSE